MVSFMQSIALLETALSKVSGLRGQGKGNRK